MILAIRLQSEWREFVIKDTTMSDKKIEIVTPFAKPENEFTMIHNSIFDIIMPECTPTEWMVLCAIIRKTRGWDKECDEISYSQLIKMTGIKSTTTVNKCVDELEQKGMIAVRRGDITKSNLYYLNTEYQIAIPKNDIGVSQNLIKPIPKNDNTKDSLKENIKDLKDSGGEKTPLAALPNQEELLEESRRKAEKHRAGVIKALEQSAKDKREEVLDNLYDYPPEVQNTIAAFSRCWKLPPPPKNTSMFKKWIKDAKEAKKLIKNTGLSAEEAMKEAYYVWKTPPKGTSRKDFEGKHTVYNIGSILTLLWETSSGVAVGEPRRKVKHYVDADGNPREREI
jgi:phage replication O-like protein O